MHWVTVMGGMGAGMPGISTFEVTCHLPGSKSSAQTPPAAESRKSTTGATTRILRDMESTPLFDPLLKIARILGPLPQRVELLGRLCYQLKHRWRDGSTHIVLDPVDLLERLATFVPPPRFHMVRYHGILAPCARWRDHVVPQRPASEPSPKRRRGVR
jgi:hypothetical protein